MGHKRNIGIAKRLNLLNEFIHAINKCETKQEVYEYLASQLPNLIPADSVSVSIFDDFYNKLERHNLIGKEALREKTSRSVGQTFKINTTTACLALLKQDAFVTDYPSSNCSKCAAQADCAAAGKLGYVASMTTLIYIKGHAIGTISVASYTRKVYTQKVQRIFETIALLVSACLEKIHFIKSIGNSKSRINLHAKRLKMLTSISMKLSQATRENDMLEIIGDHFLRVISNVRLSLVVVDKENQEFIISQIHSEGKLKSVKTAFPMNESLLISAMETGEPQFYSNFGDKKTAEMKKLGIEYAWSIPIFENNEVTRLLNIGIKVVPQHKNDLIDIFTILSSIFSAALENIRANEVIAYRAHYDLLTGAYNRHSFHEKITNLINEEPAKPFSLLIVDLDNFKELNDFHGHMFGDNVLTKVVQHFQTIFGKEKFIARLGGDEFAVIGDFTAHKPSLLNGMKLNSMKIKHDGRTIPISFSVGVAHFPKHAQSMTKLMSYADLALYEAKTSPSKIKVFNRAMAKQFNQKFNILSDFKDALLREEIIPFYQPIIDLKTQKLHALEALARWDHKKRGILSPADFSIVFEVPELCGKIAYAMHRRICKDMGQWKRSGVEFQQVGLNVETVNLIDPAFPLKLLSELHKNGLKPSEYAIEITENSILHSQNKYILDNLHSLRLAGMAILLDDFGTGFSSMAHLKNLPITTVKLDKSYVTNSLNNTTDYHIVSSIISLTKKLNINTLAEGIETKETKRLFVDLGCDYGQGYLFSRPLPAKEIPEFINKLNNKKMEMIAA